MGIAIIAIKVEIGQLWLYYNSPCLIVQSTASDGHHEFIWLDNGFRDSFWGPVFEQSTGWKLL